MKIVALIARILLGVVFFVFGLNGFLHFIPVKTFPTGLAGEFLTVLIQSHYVLFVSAIQIAGGALLLVNRYVPLGLTLLGPVIVNIILYHALMDRSGLPAGDRRRDSLGHRRLPPTPILLQPLRAENFLGDLSRQHDWIREEFGISFCGRTGAGCATNVSRRLLPARAAPGARGPWHSWG